MFKAKSMAFVSTVAAITREPLLTWKATQAHGHPVDYYVPNFGVDREIQVNNANLNEAEQQVGHKWVVTAEQLKKTATEDYRVPNFGVDHDVKLTQGNY